MTPQLRYHFKIKFGGLREIVLERDNWQCVKCGMNNEQHIVVFGRSITVDHIDGNGSNSKNPNNTLNNLQTLCLRCHGKKDVVRLANSSRLKRFKNLEKGWIKNKKRTDLRTK